MRCGSRRRGRRARAGDADLERAPGGRKYAAQHKVYERHTQTQGLARRLATSVALFLWPVDYAPAENVQLVAGGHDGRMVVDRFISSGRDAVRIPGSHQYRDNDQGISARSLSPKRFISCRPQARLSRRRCSTDPCRDRV